VLAYELSKIVHGEKAAGEARDAAKALFGEKDLSQAGNIPTTEFAVPDKPISVVDFISLSGLFGSKSEARRMIQQGGAYINDKNYLDMNEQLDPGFFSDTIVIRAGKKRYWKMIPKK
jgi:tyrosyl-tRNA synthetase